MHNLQFTSLSFRTPGSSSRALLLSGSRGLAVREALPFTSPLSPANTRFTASSLESLWSTREATKDKGKRTSAQGTKGASALRGSSLNAPRVSPGRSRDKILEGDAVHTKFRISW